MIRIIQYALFVAVVAGGAWAAWFFFVVPADERELEALRAFDQEVARLSNAAVTGSTNAMIELADLLLAPDSLKPDPKRGIEYLTAAARAADPEGQFRLGLTYADGKYLRQDFAEAAKWYRSAALAGSHGSAYFHLAELHNTGKGVIHDYAKALEYYVAAAERGHPIAQYFVGLMYKEGWGVRADGVKALKWVLLALPHKDRIQAHDPSFNPEETHKQLIRDLNITQINRGKQQAQTFVPRR